ncbi:hypothetical protein HWV62_41234 [Athelia sp. TMB]|nr:hypothetical protein HWV62_41234 [Athelia sp. TMB]
MTPRKEPPISLAPAEDVKSQDVMLVSPVAEASETLVAPVTPITPPSSPRPAAKRARGFAAFAGAGSPFAPSPLAPNRRSTTPTPRRPVWLTDANPLADGVLSLSPFALSRQENPNGPTDDAEPASALAAVETRVSNTVAHITGEEDETVQSELRGVKLFIKRGIKAFTGGMPGHVKLLSHNQRTGERLLFRREPLGKVSMNVSMGSTVRCSFDLEDNVLRIVLKEAVEDGNGAQELVIYAIKRGRVSKQDFTDFAEALVAHFAPKSQAAVI